MYNKREGQKMGQLINAISQSELMMPASLLSMNNPTRPKSRLQIAKRVYQLAASGGFPYTGMSSKQWAKKWLPSESFRLMEIDINAAASPHLPKNPERVAFRLLCSADSVDPIVVDLNKQQVGKSHLGFVPEVVVVDGKHRKQGQLLQGRTRILAWVGCRAEKKIRNAVVIDKLKFKQVQALGKPGSKPAIEASAMHYVSGQKEYNFRPGTIAAAASLHCAVSSSVNPTILDQSAGEGGSRPKDAVLKAKKKVIEDCNACGPAHSQGHLEDSSRDDPSGSDYEGKVPSASDQGTFVSPSDRLHYSNKPNEKAPGAKNWGTGMISADPIQKPFQDSPSPGSGVGPRLHRSTGATRSEMSRLAGINAKSKVIDKIFVKKNQQHGSKPFPNLK